MPTLSFKGLALTTLAVLSAALVLAFPEIALAQQPDTTFLEQGTSRVTAVWTSVKQIILVVGAIGLVVMAIFAFFGRFRWAYFFSLAGGLFLVLFADQLINFLGGDTSAITRGSTL